MHLIKRRSGWMATMIPRTSGREGGQTVLRFLMAAPAVVLLLAGPACTKEGASVPVARRSPDTPSNQGPGDSLEKLSRLLLTDPDPHTIGQAMVCENLRLMHLYGEVKAVHIAAEVRDRVYRSIDERALQRVDSMLANHTFDPSCGSAPGTNAEPLAKDSVP